MKTLFKTLLVTALLVAGVQWSSAQEKEQPKLYAVAFHADWCPACKAIGPSVMELQSDLKGNPVQFVKFDFTSDEAKMKTKKIANDLGLEKILTANNGTGFVILVDAKTKKEVGRLNRKQSEKEMLSQVSKLL